MKTDSGTLVHAALKQITPSKTNPRKSFNGADWPGFVENIRLHGVIVPGIGRYLESGPKGRIELVAGERRYRAAKEAGLKTMPLMIHGLTELEARHEARRCLSCGVCYECDNCFAACPEQAIAKLGPGKGYHVDPALCTGCAVCFEQCPCHAIEMVAEADMLEPP